MSFSEVVAKFGLNHTDLSAFEIDSLELLEFLYEKPHGKALLDSVVANPKQISISQFNGEPHYASTGSSSGVVNINYEWITNNMLVIGKDGIARPPLAAAILAHEIKHSISAIEDPDNDIAAFNPSQMYGPQVETENLVNTENGWVERSAYLAGTTSLKAFQLLDGYDYTQGAGAGSFDVAFVDAGENFFGLNAADYSVSNRYLIVLGDNSSVLAGGSNDDFLYLSGGNDVMISSAGNDYLNGGDGVDALDYSGTDVIAASNFIQGVHISIAWSVSEGTLFALATDGWGDNDTAVGFETYVFGDMDDKVELAGDAAALFESAGLWGLAGGGQDQQGDLLDLAGMDVSGGFGVVCNLELSQLILANSGVLGGDVDCEGFENVIGTSGNDTIIGNDLANILNGKGGADELKGGGGDDILVFDQDDTIVLGGEGYDAGIYRGTGALQGFDMNAHELEVLVAGSGSDTIIFDTQEANGQVAMIAGGQGNDIFHITTQGDQPVIVFGGAGADEYRLAPKTFWDDDSQTFAWDIYGIMTVEVDGLTEANFHQFRLDDIDVGSGFDWSVIDVIILNPGSTDRVLEDFGDDFVNVLAEDWTSGYADATFLGGGVNEVFAFLWTEPVLDSHLDVGWHFVAGGRFDGESIEANGSITANFNPVAEPDWLLAA